MNGLPSFSDRSRDVAMETNFRGNFGENGLLAFIRRIGIPTEIGISQIRF